MATIDPPLETSLLIDGRISPPWWDWFALVTLNSTASSEHDSSPGTDHSDVVLNNTHRLGDGSDHSEVALNITHRTSDGSDHTFIDQDVTISSSPTFAGLTVTGDLIVGGRDMMKWAALQG